jgi:hypothetical protein
VLITQGETGSVNSIILQGTTVIAPVTFGDGVRCVGGNLKRIIVKAAVNGWMAYPEGAEDPITVRSTILGDPIPPGSTRHYQTYYRDSVGTFCPIPVGDNWNVSSAVSIVW